MDFHSDKIIIPQRASENNILKLNVGGQLFVTSVQTILSQPNSMLAKLVEPNSPFLQVKDDNGAIFIDRVCFHINFNVYSFIYSIIKRTRSIFE